MQLIRTTLRLKENLKKRAEKKAFDENTSLQAIFNSALEQYLEKDAKKQAKRIVFKTHDLGVNLDNLRREDFYPEP
ncbi:MAG: hypothetical protein HYW62_00765 [Candidatus Levybacteria bacterium]|nr:hypothetical protein [Candidatus Levybacteria bacterium]